MTKVAEILEQVRRNEERISTLDSAIEYLRFFLPVDDDRERRRKKVITVEDLVSPQASSAVLREVIATLTDLANSYGEETESYLGQGIDNAGSGREEEDGRSRVPGRGPKKSTRRKPRSTKGKAKKG
jgi:hypothetical protein